MRREQELQDGRPIDDNDDYSYYGEYDDEYEDDDEYYGGGLSDMKAPPHAQKTKTRTITKTDKGHVSLRTPEEKKTHSERMNLKKETQEKNQSEKGKEEEKQEEKNLKRNAATE